MSSAYSAGAVGACVGAVVGAASLKAGVNFSVPHVGDRSALRRMRVISGHMPQGTSVPWSVLPELPRYTTAVAPAHGARRAPGADGTTGILACAVGFVGATVANSDLAMSLSKRSGGGPRRQKQQQSSQSQAAVVPASVQGVIEMSSRALVYPGLNRVDADFVDKLVELLKSGGRWEWNEAQLLVRDAAALLRKQPTLQHITVPVGRTITVVGDVHGQLFDLCAILDTHGRPGPEYPYVFNGDFVDRGSYSVETLLVLLALKVQHPDYVHLARGNHESHAMNRPYGFMGEVLTKYSKGAYDDFQNVFAQLPLAHVINEQVLVVHGGLPRNPNAGLAEIEALDRVAKNRSVREQELFSDLLWNDPRDRPGIGESERGYTVATFGPDVTERFLRANGLRFVIRSHECKDRGHQWQHNHKCLTVFSAPNYADCSDNRGAVVKLWHGVSHLLYDVQQFNAAPRPKSYVPAMAYSPLTPLSRKYLSEDAKVALNGR
eukprot:TRINITY_DN29336_c0_g1_i1.p1 TRINITY_DN29336_c0_g1~~TRINITY_DN29336_c0_g1_i1.p1  ORF type:complete len:491 (+),score=56.57 TRINITY_DN29336_c0_g1_i1:57-1529(+)